MKYFLLLLLLTGCSTIEYKDFYCGGYHSQFYSGVTNKENDELCGKRKK